MTALLRMGAEWRPVGAGDSSGFSRAGYAFHGIHSSAAVTVETPGRTGGRMWRMPRATYVYGGASHTSYSSRVSPRPSPAIVNGAVARVYMRFNQYPSVTVNPVGGAELIDPGIPILGLSTGLTGWGTSQAYVWLFNDGTFGAGFVRHYEQGRRMPIPDTYQAPLNDWLMIELAIVDNGYPAQPRIVVRVTPPNGRPRIVYCAERHIGVLPENYARFPAMGGPYTLPTQAQLAFGQLLDGGSHESISDMEMYGDDAGINSLDGDENNTWLGPGAVRIARPVSAVATGVGWTCGRRENTANGAKGRTIPDHPDPINPPDEEDLQLCSPMPFADALNNNPIVNPASGGSIGSPFPRCQDDDIVVVSAGSDYHEHNTVWGYDWPRITSAGDQLDLTCDAADREGVICFAMPVSIVARNTLISVLDTPPTDRHFAIFTDNEAPPTPEDQTDRATIVFTKFGAGTSAGGSTFPGTDQAIWGGVGRQQQFPELADEPVVSIRREQAGGKTNETSLPHIPDPQGEFTLFGVGVVYESGWEEQPPIPNCAPGELIIGEMTSHIRQIRGGRVGSAG